MSGFRKAISRLMPEGRRAASFDEMTERMRAEFEELKSHRDYTVLNSSSFSWLGEYPKFPYCLDNRIVYRFDTASAADKGGWFELDESDRDKVVKAIEAANAEFLAATTLAEIPALYHSLPSSVNPDNVFIGDFALLRAKPYTKTGRKPKFPFILTVQTNDESLQARLEVSLFPDGGIGRIESSMLEKSSGTWFVVTSRLEEGELTVSRVAATLPNGDMPTLYTIGR